MENKIIALIVIVILAIVGVSAFLITQNSEDNITIDVNQTNVTNKTDTNITNKTNSSVSAVLTGPATATEGDTVTLTWTVTNNGATNITNVSGSDQNELYDFGTIGPGEAKIHKFTVNIPTSQQLIDDFDDNSTVANPFAIGGFGLSYIFNGETYNIQSNAIEISLN